MKNGYSYKQQGFEIQQLCTWHELRRETAAKQKQQARVMMSLYEC